MSRIERTYEFYTFYDFLSVAHLTKFAIFREILQLILPRFFGSAFNPGHYCSFQNVKQVIPSSKSEASTHFHVEITSLVLFFIVLCQVISVIIKYLFVSNISW